MNDSVDGPRSRELWERTDAVIPRGGIYLTRSARFAGRDVLPGFIRSAKGCRIEDADGRSYLDFNCGNGPNILGYCHPEVDDAAAEQAGEMDLSAFFPEMMPLYAEQLLEAVAGFDWTIFTKNGSDSTNLALRTMRSSTHRPCVILFRDSYHGFGAEIALHPETPATGEQRHVVRVPWNDAGALERAVEELGDRLAGIMISPLDQNPSQETREASPEIVAAIHAARERTGCRVALDDVRAGFRMHPKGSHVGMGLEPDLICLGKPLANGYSVSAVLGRNELREGAERIAFTATYMFSAVAFRAGMKTLEIYERDSVFEHMVRMGTRLREGIVAAGRAHGHEDVVMSGPPTMPTFLFRDDVKAKRARIFGGHAARLGAIFHPRLNWFLSLAHQPDDIEEAIDIAGRAFALTPLTPP